MDWMNAAQTWVRKVGRRTYDAVRGRDEQDAGLFDPSSGRRLLGPGEGASSWVGAPSLFHDVEDGLYVTLRWRDRGRRGWRTGIARLDDGVEVVWSATKDAFGARSLEGAALGREGGEYVLYQSYKPDGVSPWRVDRLRADALEGFDPAAGERVGAGEGHVKDPVLHDGRLFLHAPSRSFRSTSTLVVEDGDVGGELSYGGDDGRSPRLTSLVELDAGVLALYDWRPTVFHVGAERARYGRLEAGQVVPLVPRGRSLLSGVGDGSLRYVAGARMDDAVVFVYEKEVAGGGHGLWMNRVPLSSVRAVLW